MRYLVGLALVLACGLVLLWREARTVPTPVPVPAAAPSAASHPSTGRALAPGAELVAPARAAALVPQLPAGAQPPGGIRAWSPTATPTSGPDPFAPVPQIRTLDETRAGLDEPAAVDR